MRKLSANENVSMDILKYVIREGIDNALVKILKHKDKLDLEILLESM